MLKIEAIFRPERISAVTNALLDVGVTGFNYKNVKSVKKAKKRAKTNAKH